MLSTDVAIVGAGPSGATASKNLAEMGVKVILIDQAVFPREKVCGDGVTAEGIEAIKRMGLAEWVKQFPEMDTLRLSSPNHQILDITIHTKAGECNGRTIPRKILDNRLVQSAVDSGVRLLEKNFVTNIEINKNKASVITKEQTIEAQLILLADGSHASVTRRAGLIRNSEPELIAVRQYLAGDTGPASRLEIHFHPWVIPGYNWIFPLGQGKINIGTGTFIRRVKNGRVDLKENLNQFKYDPINGKRLEKTKQLSPIKGHPLRAKFGSTITHSNRILVLGDAAGLINPFSGEGIAPAMQSGEIAAKYALNAFKDADFSENQLSTYTKELMTRFMPDRKAARLLQNILNFPWIVNLLFRRMKQDRELALLVAFIIIGQKSPRLVLYPSTLLRLLS